MRINSVHIKNFRLLFDVAVDFDSISTVIVGRNNSGKTSLAEVSRRVFGDRLPVFALEDFSLQVHEQFWSAFVLHSSNAEEEAVRAALPAIEMRLNLGYTDQDDYASLSDFIIDLDPECAETIAVVRYALEDGKIERFFAGIEPPTDVANDLERRAFFKTMKERVPRTYKATLTAEDPNDVTNKKVLEWRQLSRLIRVDFINAQRGLDDNTSKDNEVLGRVLSALFETASLTSADPADRTTAEKLEESLRTIQDDLGANFNQQLDALLPAFSLFGYPGLADSALLTETNFDVGRLLKDHTRIRYPGVNGVHLPETYNGLGARNLIFILLKLHAFFKAQKAAQPAPGMHLIFIEEPEAHLHPQMQEVFIEKLAAIACAFSVTYNDGASWPVQFAVSTHSSHIANRAAFRSTRYFLSKTSDPAGKFRATSVKDLGRAFSAQLKSKEDFLHKYMTLTRCDLLFADKAILIEGPSERLMLPVMISKLDADLKLSRQYLSIVEVGGAYAHLFFELLEFLELQTLVITDLDSTLQTFGKYVACPVSRGTHVSNACIKDWFSPDVSPTTLLAKAEHEKITGSRRIAFQIPETVGSPCGRSFEQAFVLANPTSFEFFDDPPTETQSWDKVVKCKKSDFALQYAIYDLDWIVPRYIREGLVWLAGAHPRLPTEAIAAPPMET